MSKQVLLSREASTMVSSWDEVLCVEQTAPGKWRMSTCSYEWIANIFDVVSEDELYDEDGNLRVPETYQGKAIMKLADGEYLQTYDLVEREVSAEFDAQSSAVGRKFCESEEWADDTDFPDVWAKVLGMVSAAAPQS